jgi:hypothetical protein
LKRRHSLLTAHFQYNSFFIRQAANTTFIKLKTICQYKRPKKIYRLKEDQAFSLSLELGRREKFARHPSADFLLHFLGGGGDFVDTVILVKVV